ncbi:MAG: thioredoxin family protein, partial [Kiritimatiellae bacterium]|nr:thioredoxin family protein [Kiritimatiellia bacterium]
MKRLASSVCVLFAMVFLASVSSGASLWETDFEDASATAKASNRYIMLDFSGSDWCGWCVRLDNEVFSRKAFKNYAKDNLVCVLIDFPRGKQLKKALKE